MVPSYEDLQKRVRELEQENSRLRGSRECLANAGMTDFLLLLNKMSAMIHSIDQDGLLVNVSDLWLEKMGYTRAEVIGQPSVNFLTEASKAYARNKALPQFFRNGLADDVPYQFVKKDGTVIDVLLSAIALRDDDGDFLGSLALLTDVTHFNRADTALQERTRILNDILNKAGDGICVCHSIPTQPYLRFTHWNPRMTEITGYSHDEINRIGWFQAMFPDTTKRKEAIDRITRMCPGDERVAEERMVTARDGRERTLSISTTLLQKMQGCAHLLAVMQDITERRQLMDDLEKSRERYDLATKAGKVGVWDWDLRTGEMFVSPNLKDLLGYEEHEIANHIEDWQGHVYAGDREALEQALAPCLEGRQDTFRLEHRMVHKDGSLRWFLASGRMERDAQGRPVRCIGTDTDITRFKFLEKELYQANKLEALGTLAGGIAHDFNNILAAIGNLALLVQDDVPAGSQTAQDIAQIIRSTEQGKMLVEQVLSFARKDGADSGKRPILISPMLKELVKLMQASFPASISLHLEMSDVSCMIEAEPMDIQKVVMNLCTNAREALEANRDGVVTIHLERRDVEYRSAEDSLPLEPGTYAFLRISDNGPGIPEAIRPRIFDPFFSTKSTGRGTGLGLAQVKTILDSYAGTIQLSAHQEHGTAFEIYWPCIDRESNRPIQKKGASKSRRQTILLVEDEDMVREPAMRILEQKGYSVCIAHDGSEALDCLTQGDYDIDIVLTDYSMPGLSGRDLAVELLDKRPDLPVIVYSGHIGEDLENELLDLGVRAVLQKPLNWNDLLSLIAALV